MALFDNWLGSGRAEQTSPAPSLTVSDAIENHIRGALRFVRTADGLIQPYRFSARQMEMLEHIGRGGRAVATSGIVIDFITDGDAVSFDCKVTRALDREHDVYATVMQHEGVLGKAEEGVIDGIDIVAGGLRSYTTAVVDGTIRLGFDNPDHGLVEVRIFLPYIMSVAVGNLAVNGVVEPAPERGYLLALGDSITQGFVVGCPSLTYPALVATSLGLDVVNQGIAGHVFDRRTLRGLEELRDNPPQAITVAYGTNDWSRRESPRAMQRAAERYLGRLLRTFPGVPIYVLSPLWRADEDEPVPSGVPLAWMGAMLESLCKQRDQLRFVDGYHAIPKNSVMLADGRLHPGSVDAGLVADALISAMTADGVGEPASGATHLAPAVEEDESLPTTDAEGASDAAGEATGAAGPSAEPSARSRLLANLPRIEDDASDAAASEGEEAPVPSATGEQAAEAEVDPAVAASEDVAPAAEEATDAAPTATEAVDGDAAIAASEPLPAEGDAGAPVPDPSVPEAEDDAASVLAPEDELRGLDKAATLPPAASNAVRAALEALQADLERGVIDPDDAIGTAAVYAARMAMAAGATRADAADAAGVVTDLLTTPDEEPAPAADVEQDVTPSAGAFEQDASVSAGEEPAPGVDVAPSEAAPAAAVALDFDLDEDWDDLDAPDDWDEDVAASPDAPPASSGFDDLDEEDDLDDLDEDEDWLGIQAIAAAMDLYESEASLLGSTDPVPDATTYSLLNGDIDDAYLTLIDIDEETRFRAGAPEAHPEFDRLVRTVWRLRQPDGCPWDLEQTHRSLVGNMVEEAYEAVETIQEGDVDHLREELGDVLEQVLLHAQIAADLGEFTLDDVCRDLNEKLVRRHPHVFGSEVATTAEEALEIWKDVKRAEREAAGDVDGSKGLLDSVPRSLPALMQAQEISDRAAQMGFDWESVDRVWDKVTEESAEFVREPQGSEAAKLEFGDLLFTLVNVARFEGIDAEEALRASTEKFRMRWASLEQVAFEWERDVDSLTPLEFDLLWEHAKSRENLGAMLRLHS